MYGGLWQALEPLYGQVEAQAVSRYVLEQLSGKEWFALRQAFDAPPAPPQAARLRRMLPRLLQAEPVQYVTGTAHFYGREFVVNPAVLIPRGETEELMCWIRDTITASAESKTWRILDLGTGSGCIPVSLGLELEARHIGAELYGTDLSAAALEVASQNARKHGLAVKWEQQNIFEATAAHYRDMDVVVSNPPYIPLHEKDSLARHVVEYEPAQALFVPDEDPLIFYRRILELAASWLAAGGYLFFEIHESQGAAVRALFEQPTWEAVELRQDIHGKDRMLRARKAIKP